MKLDELAREATEDLRRATPSRHDSRTVVDKVVRLKRQRRRTRLVALGLATSLATGVVVLRIVDDAASHVRIVDKPPTTTPPTGPATTIEGCGYGQACPQRAGAYLWPGMAGMASDVSAVNVRFDLPPGWGIIRSHGDGIDLGDATAIRSNGWTQFGLGVSIELPYWALHEQSARRSADLVTYLETITGITVTSPSKTTLGGRPAWRVDVTVAKNADLPERCRETAGNNCLTINPSRVAKSEMYQGERATLLFTDIRFGSSTRVLWIWVWDHDTSRTTHASPIDGAAALVNSIVIEEP